MPPRGPETDESMIVRLERSPSDPPRWLRAALAPLTAAAVLFGIWVAGGVLTDDFRTSMALVSLWFAAVVVAAVLVWRRAPALRLPVSAVALGTLLLVGGYLGLASTRDVEVNEVVARGPALAEGRFVDLAHSTTGTARIVETDRGRVLTLTGFETDPGPDLYVYLAPGLTSGEDVDGALRLARLKGNVGSQQYELPAGFDVSAGATAVIWCRAFSVAFGAARLPVTAPA